jgi:hypothetical protein
VFLTTASALRGQNQCPHESIITERRVPGAELMAAWQMDP